MYDYDWRNLPDEELAELIDQLALNGDEEGLREILGALDDD